MTVLKGVLEAYYEVGTDGTYWSILKDGLTGYEALESIEQGDHLKVFGADGTVLFDGTINEDHQAGWMERPLLPGSGIGQPAALGYWIHWTQVGWTPDAWASLFLSHSPPLRAELTKAVTAPA